MSYSSIHESSSRIHGKTPVFQDEGQLSSSLLSRRKREAGRGFCAGGEDCQQFRWSISSHLGRISESEWHIASNTRSAPISPMPDTKATKTLKQLAEKGVLAWVGRGTNDPYQYYHLNENA